MILLCHIAGRHCHFDIDDIIYISFSSPILPLMSFRADIRWLRHLPADFLSLRWYYATLSIYCHYCHWCHYADIFTLLPFLWYARYYAAFAFDYGFSYYCFRHYDTPLAAIIRQLHCRYAITPLAISLFTLRLSWYCCLLRYYFMPLTYFRHMILPFSLFLTLRCSFSLHFLYAAPPYFAERASRRRRRHWPIIFIIFAIAYYAIAFTYYFQAFAIDIFAIIFAAFIDYWCRHYFIFIIIIFIFFDCLYAAISPPLTATPPPAAVFTRQASTLTPAIFDAAFRFFITPLSLSPFSAAPPCHFFSFRRFRWFVAFDYFRCRHWFYARRQRQLPPPPPRQLVTAARYYAGFLLFSLSSDVFFSIFSSLRRRWPRQHTPPPLAAMLIFARFSPPLRCLFYCHATPLFSLPPRHDGFRRHFASFRHSLSRRFIIDWRHYAIIIAFIVISLSPFIFVSSIFHWLFSLIIRYFLSLFRWFSPLFSFHFRFSYAAIADSWLCFHMPPRHCRHTMIILPPFSAFSRASWYFTPAAIFCAFSLSSLYAIFSPLMPLARQIDFRYIRYCYAHDTAAAALIDISLIRHCQMIDAIDTPFYWFSFLSPIFIDIIILFSYCHFDFLR